MTLNYDYLKKYYFIPCIIFFSFGFNTSKNNAAAIGIAAIIKKNADIEYFSEILSINEPVIPAIKFAIADAVNHKPKSSPVNFFGDSLDTYERPTDDKQSSPIVWKK